MGSEFVRTLGALAVTLFVLGVGALAAPPGWFPALLIAGGVVLGGCAGTYYLRGERARARTRKDALRSIAALVREAPRRWEGKDLNCASICGALLSDAIALGFLSLDKWRELRHVMTLSAAGHMEHQLGEPGPGVSRPPPSWHAFVNGYAFLRIQDGLCRLKFGKEFVMEGCARWAALIEEQACA